MSTLVRIYQDVTEQVFGKRSHIPKKAEPSFQKIERILTRADVSLYDYTLTTFTDRIWICQQLGYLPWQTFVSLKSLERYVDRLESCAEVTLTKKETNNRLNMELTIGEVIIALTLEGLDCDDEIVEQVASVTPGWMTDHRRPMLEALTLLQRKYQSSGNSYSEIATQIRSRREKLESRIQAKNNSSDIRGSLVE